MRDRTLLARTKCISALVERGGASTGQRATDCKENFIDDAERQGAHPSVAR